jgi:hypothetical protein
MDLGKLPLVSSRSPILPLAPLGEQAFAMLCDIDLGSSLVYVLKKAL